MSHSKMTNIIYEPRGKALEYSPLAANLYRGCSHGCKYCYAPSATFKHRDLFHSDSFIQPRSDVAKQFEKDCIELSGDKRECLLSFTTDPYQKIESELMLTRLAIKCAKENDIFLTILTKSALASRDFDLLQSMKRKKFGMTLTTDIDSESLEWEPFASLPKQRIDCLMDAWTKGISTFVSFEPVINPEAVLRLIDLTHQFVDFYKVGKLNHHKFQKTIDWVLFRELVTKKLDSLGKKYMVKKDLLAA